MNADEIERGRQRWQQRYDNSRKRDADFTTLSGEEVQPVYGPPAGQSYEGFERIGWPGSTRTPGVCTPPATAGGPGPSGSSPASATPSRPMSATG